MFVKFQCTFQHFHSLKELHCFYLHPFIEWQIKWYCSISIVRIFYIGWNCQHKHKKSLYDPNICFILLSYSHSSWILLELVMQSLCCITTLFTLNHNVKVFRWIPTHYQTKEYIELPLKTGFHFIFVLSKTNKHVLWDKFDTWGTRGSFYWQQQSLEMPSMDWVVWSRAGSANMQCSLVTSGHHNWSQPPGHSLEPLTPLTIDIEKLSCNQPPNTCTDSTRKSFWRHNYFHWNQYTINEMEV